MTNKGLLPRCLIKADIRLLIVKISQWNCLNVISSESVKWFLIRSVVYLHMQTSLKAFVNVLKKIFTIAYSKFQNPLMIQEFNFINAEIKSFSINLKFKKIKLKKNHKKIYFKYLNLTLAKCESKLNEN